MGNKSEYLGYEGGDSDSGRYFERKKPIKDSLTRYVPHPTPENARITGVRTR